MPVVLTVLISFSIALPGFISFYLWRHRQELYSTSIYQRVGWLYDPFVRGAEFWMVHDVLMKMMLTGMLIYVPSESRAGVATLICIIACCNLNYFEPHKNKLLFWLSQISFITTAFKYVVALLLSDNASINTEGVDEKEQETLSLLLITLDITFIVSSMFAVLASVCVLYTRLKQIQQQHREEEDAETNNSTKVHPVGTNGARHSRRLSGVEKSVKLREVRMKFGTKSKEYTDAVREAQQSIMSQEDQTMTKTADEIVDTLHEEHRLRKEVLEQDMKSKQTKQRRNTQVRLAARAKLKKMKTMSKIPAFQLLKQKQMEIMIDAMHLEKYSFGEALTEQNQPATKFYILMEGECAAYIGTNYASDMKVGVLPTFSFFGEHSLLGELDQTGICNATVRIESEIASVLVLHKNDFVELIHNGILDNDIWKMLKSVEKIDLQRQSENNMALSKQSEV